MNKTIIIGHNAKLSDIPYLNPHERRFTVYVAFCLA